jgi:hypothetical protein
LNPRFSPTGKIRNILGHFIGKKLVDITQHEPEDEQGFIMLMFDDGTFMKFPETWPFSFSPMEQKEQQ